MVTPRRARRPAVRRSLLFLAAVPVAVLVGCAGAGEPAAVLPLGAPAASSSLTDNTKPDVADRAADRSGDTETDDHTEGAGGNDDAVLPDADDSGDHADDGDTAVLDAGGDTINVPDDTGGDDIDMNDSADDDTAADDTADDGGDTADELNSTGDGDDTADHPDDGDVAVLDAGADAADELGDTGGDGIDMSDSVGEAAADGADVGGDTTDLLDGTAADKAEGSAAVAAVESVRGGAGASGARFVVDGFGGVLVEGPCGWLGPVCPLVEGAAPIDAGGRLAYNPSREDWSPWVGRVLDLCDDHEALAALNKEWYIGASNSIDYSATIPPEAMGFVHAERQRHPVVCSRAEAQVPLWKCWGDGSGRSIARLREHLEQFTEPLESSEVEAWAESVGLDCWDAAAAGVRYVYMTANGPLLPQSSVEAAVEDYLERVARAGDQGGLTTGFPLGASYSDYLYVVETPVDALFVLPDRVGVTGGVLRGLAQNHSGRLWARNVTVAATDPTGATGEWRWPLTVQPGEILPFEIENWTGTQTTSEIDFTITADLSPTIDLTRSLDLHWYKTEDTKGTYLLYDDYPVEMGAFPHGTTAFEALDNTDKLRWIQFDLRRKGSTAHPRLAETAQQQTIENLTVYAALLDEDGAVDEVWEMTPMTRTPGQFGDGSEEAQARGDMSEYKRGDWLEARTISTIEDWESHDYYSSTTEYATVGYVGDPSWLYIWAGGAAPGPRPPDDGAR